ncbi:T9SS type A sorting domain-containing protein, partial [Lutibacter sp.]|uniref:T9SS type A sorting domain-containing protein n=1 Tax=Lutibacter sp. TaxID=1925666 RepID=UPI003567940F
FDVSSTGSIEIDQQGTGNSYRYNYWSSPVNSTGANYTVEGVLRDGTDPNNIKTIDFGNSYAYADGASTDPIKLSTYWMYKKEDTGLGNSAWARAGKNINIKAGQGFTMKGSNTNLAEQNYTFTGQPNNGTINLPVNANNEYLVGNPYASAIDAYQFIDDNSPLGTASIGNGGSLVFWEHYGGDTHNLRDYQGGYAILTKADAVPASSNVPAGVSTLGSSVKGAPGRYIPVGQAFFVVGSPTGGNIQFNNGQRVFVKESSGNSIFMKSSNAKSKIVTANKTDLRPKFRIGFDAPAINHRQLLLTIDENTSDAVDWGYDAEIYDIISDDMYWMIDSKKYVIQATNTLSLDTEIPLGIETKEGGIMKIKVDALENVAENTSIYIKDNLTDETYDITNQDFEVNLEAGEYKERFLLTFQPSLKTLQEVALIEGVHIFMNNTISELQLNRIVDTEIESISLFNYLGQQVKTWSINTDNRFMSFPIHMSTGVYIAQVHTTAGIITKKIIIE